MKISNIEIKNYKKIECLNVNIPKENRVICFVGENGSNKSSVISYLYKLTRSTTPLVSPSDGSDIFNESTVDIKDGAEERYYDFSMTISNGTQSVTPSGASISNYDTLTKETSEKLRVKYGNEFASKKNFLNKGLSNPYIGQGVDLVKDSVLLFRPSNRYEVAYYEEPLNDEGNNWSSDRNVIGQRKFPFRVVQGIQEATGYFLDVILDYFVATASQTPSFNLHNNFQSVLRSIDPSFAQLTIRPFPNKGISSKNLPALSSLSAGQSDWLVTSINILIQMADLISNNGTYARDIKNVPGIVFIDEMDKNYHPKLQETILPWFIDNFPNIQFVISTHSPYMVRSLGDNSVVIKLPDGELISDNFTYWDINEVSNKVFGRDLGFSELVQKQLNQLKGLLRNNDTQSSITLYDGMVGKSESLDQELKRVVYTLGSSEFIEVLNARS